MEADGIDIGVRGNKRDYHLNEKVMYQFLISKIAQASLTIVAFVTYIYAEIQETIPGTVGALEEAARYGFAVLVLFIVLTLLYQDWNKERDYSRTEIKKLNTLIGEMVKLNREALTRSTRAIEQQNYMNERMINFMLRHKKDQNSKN